MKQSGNLILFLFCLTTITIAAQKGVFPLSTNNQQQSTHKTYAVIVGISDYQSPQIPDLQFSHRDAIAFIDWLKSSAGGKIANEHIKILLNEKATLAQFGAALDWLLEVCKSGDQAIIYFSGHGDVETRTRFQPGFLLCWDAPPKVYTAGGAYGLFYLQDIISTLSIDKSVRVIVVSDACHSGKLAGSTVGGPQATALSMKQQFANEVKILSCQPEEVSIEGTIWGGGRGVFSFHLIEGLTGMADENLDKNITLSEIDRYLEKHVIEETLPRQQTPVTVGSKQFILAKVNDSCLSALKNFKSKYPTFFETIGTKGVNQNNGLVSDSVIAKLCSDFNQAIQANRLLEGDSISAIQCYLQLQKIDSLHTYLSSMKRILAAALQDDVQQFLNKLLQDDPFEINRWRVGSTKYEKYVEYLKVSIDLLGPSHYNYKQLMANKLFLESYILSHHNTFSYVYYSDSIRKVSRNKLYAALQFKNDAMINYLLGNSFQNSVFEDSVKYYYLKAIEFAPEWIQPYSELAWYYIDQIYSFDEAEKWLSKGLEIDSNAYGLLEMKAWLYQRVDKIDSVVEICKRMRSLHPELSNDYITLAYTYTYLNRNYKLAEENYYLAASIQSNFKSHQWILGDIERNTRRLDSAKVHSKVEDFAEIYFGDLMVFTHSSISLDLILEKARKAFIRESDPAFKYNALVIQGIVHYYKGSFSKAQEILLLAIEKYFVPTASKSLALTYLGLLLEQFGDYTNAELYFKQAIFFRPNEYVYQNKPIKSGEYFFYGNFLLQQNRLIEAEEKFRTILHKDYGSIFGFYGMAKLCAVRKLKKETLDWLELALDWYFPVPSPIVEEPLFKFIKKSKRYREMMQKHFGNEIRGF